MGKLEKLSTKTKEQASEITRLSFLNSQLERELRRKDIVISQYQKQLLKSYEHAAYYKEQCDIMGLGEIRKDRNE